MQRNLTDRSVLLNDLRLELDFQAIWSIESHFDKSIYQIASDFQSLNLTDFSVLIYYAAQRNHPGMPREEINTRFGWDDFPFLMLGFQDAMARAWFTNKQLKQMAVKKEAEKEDLRVPARLRAQKRQEAIKTNASKAYMDWEGWWSTWNSPDIGNPFDFWTAHPCDFFMLLERYIMAMEQHDLRTAMLMCQTYNMNRGKGRKQGKPEDFMIPRRAKEDKKQTVEDQIRIAREITMAFGGRDKRREVTE